MDDGIGVSYSTEFRFRCEGGHRSCERCLGPSDPGRPRCDRVIRADARMFPRGPNFFAGAPGGSRHAGRLAVSPCTTLRKELDANSAKPLTTVLTAPFWATRSYKKATRLFGFVSLRRLKRGYSCLYLNVAYPSTLSAVRQVSADGVRHDRSRVFVRERAVYC
jgi:hypothetical protein